MRLGSRIAFGVLLMAVGTLFVTAVAIRFLAAPSHAPLPAERTITSARPSPATSRFTLPPCPPAGLAMLQASSQTGHHKVILSWNASAPSPAPDSKAVGYCLYRSKTEHAAKQNPTCGNCEQINSTPIVGIGCVDDLVQDSATYYYVATAINAKGNISVSSNETIAQIPPGTKAASSHAAGSYPGCRAIATSQLTPGPAYRRPLRLALCDFPHPPFPSVYSGMCYLASNTLGVQIK